MDAYANYLNVEFSPSSKLGKEYQENMALIIRKLERAKKYLIDLEKKS